MHYAGIVIKSFEICMCKNFYFIFQLPKNLNKNYKTPVEPRRTHKNHMFFNKNWKVWKNNHNNSNTHELETTV